MFPWAESFPTQYPLYVDRLILVKETSSLSPSSLPVTHRLPLNGGCAPETNYSICGGWEEEEEPVEEPELLAALAMSPHVNSCN